MPEFSSYPIASFPYRDQNSYGIGRDVLSYNIQYMIFLAFQLDKLSHDCALEWVGTAL